MTRKTFRVEAKLEDVGFDVEFLYKGKPKTESFDCVQSMPAGKVLEFADLGLGDKDDPQAGAKAMEAIREIYEVAIVPEQREKWQKLINDPDVALDMDLYAEIAGYLVSEYTGGRPTGASLESSPQDPSSGPDSTDGASVVPLTYSISEQAKSSH